MTRQETEFTVSSKLTNCQLISLLQWEQNRTSTKDNFYKHTFADVAKWQATRSVAKLAVADTNALVRRVRFTRIPVTIRGRIAVHPVGVSVRHFRSWLVKSYQALSVANDIAIIHNRVALQACTVTACGPVISDVLGLNLQIYLLT